MQWPQLFKKCKLVGFLVILLLIVFGTALKNFKQVLADEENYRKQEWYKVNEAHELFKMHDAKEGKLL